MSYELKRPYTDRDYAHFIVEYNRKRGLKIEKTELFVFALEPNEIMGEKEIEIEVIDPETKEKHTEKRTIPYPVINPDYEQEQAERERVRIANLHLTRGDVFRGLLLAKGVTRAEIRALIEAMPEDTPQDKINKEMALIDFDEALEFYRGVALIDALGVQLGITSTQMDRFFDTKDWKELVNNVD